MLIFQYANLVNLNFDILASAYMSYIIHQRRFRSITCTMRFCNCSNEEYFSDPTSFDKHSIQFRINHVANRLLAIGCVKLLTNLNATDYASLESIGFAPDTFSSVSYSAVTSLSWVKLRGGNYAIPEVTTGLSNKASLCNIGFL